MKDTKEKSKTINPCSFVTFGVRTVIKGFMLISVIVNLTKSVHYVPMLISNFNSFALYHIISSS